MALAIDTCPRFDELPTLGETGERHSWDVFGRDDELGCLNFITPALVVAAAAEVRTGEVINLNLPLGQPQPQFWADRGVPEYNPVHNSKNIRDDYIDNLYTQGSTQWDGFRHLRYRQYGYYGGRQDDALDANGDIGIHVWAERGIVGRGVLVDVPGYMEVVPDSRLAIGPELIESILDAQGTIVRAGDILLVRTGWLEWYLRLDDDIRTELANRLSKDRSSAALPGLDPSREMTAWIWNHRIAAAAVDNPTAETVPYIREEGWAHHRLLVLLGLPLGELWSLAKLADACRREGRWSFLLSTAPMNIPRGVASPANAYAIL
jgi:Putative cyclase